MYSRLVHSQGVHILGHTTEYNVALDQCSCSKTSGMAICVSKGQEPLGGSLTYQVLKMNTAHSQACLEFQLSEGRVNRLENGVFHCASYPIHWPFFSILNNNTCKHKIYNHQSYIYLICLGIKKTIIIKIKILKK